MTTPFDWSQRIDVPLRIVSFLELSIVKEQGAWKHSSMFNSNSIALKFSWYKDRRTAKTSAAYVWKVCESSPWNSLKVSISQIVAPPFSGSSKWSSGILVVFIRQIWSFIQTESFANGTSSKVLELNKNISSPSQHDLYEWCLYELL